jgi:hypothetical protein
VNRNKRRWLNRLIAHLGGYFWMPCPLCGEMFGGHEWRERNGLPSSIPDPRFETTVQEFDTGFVRRVEISRGLGICPACTLEGKGVTP